MSSSDYIGRPESTAVPRDEVPVPHGKVICRCGAIVRVRVNGAVTKHERWLSRTLSGGVCPLSGSKAEPGTRL